jgi:hypothetical protein
VLTTNQKGAIAETAIAAHAARLGIGVLRATTWRSTSAGG